MSMIEVTKLDGSKLFVNEMNIQWIESLPDTAITFLGGARVIVRDTPSEIAARCNSLRAGGDTQHQPSEIRPSSKQ
ncbi:MAG: flagellar protein FlbD [Proteobacteria bacterium]|nr:flagellar protein FlbD [Pseudomonadota bacterium]